MKMPYVSGNGVAPDCPKTCNGTNIDINTQKYKAKTWYEVGSIAGFLIKEEKIMQELINNGPVQTGFSVYQVSDTDIKCVLTQLCYLCVM